MHCSSDAPNRSGDRTLRAEWLRMVLRWRIARLSNAARAYQPFSRVSVSFIFFDKFVLVSFSLPIEWTASGLHSAGDPNSRLSDSPAVNSKVLKNKAPISFCTNVCDRCRIRPFEWPKTRMESVRCKRPSFALAGQCNTVCSVAYKCGPATRFVAFGTFSFQANGFSGLPTTVALFELLLMKSDVRNNALIHANRSNFKSGR